MVRTSTCAAPLPHYVLLEEARRAQRLHFILPAGMLGRACLEWHLKLLCDWHTGPVANKHRGIGKYSTALYRFRFIDRDSKKRIQELADVGNRAAHGEPVQWYEVCKLLDGVEEILNRYPLSEDQLAKIEEYRKLYERPEDDEENGDEWEGGDV